MYLCAPIFSSGFYQSGIIVLRSSIILFAALCCMMFLKNLLCLVLKPSFKNIVPIYVVELRNNLKINI